MLDVLVLVCKRATDEEVRTSWGFEVASAFTRFWESDLPISGEPRLLLVGATVAVGVVWELAERMRAMAPAAEPVCSNSAALVNSFRDVVSQKNSQVRESLERPKVDDIKVEEADGSIADWLR